MQTEGAYGLQSYGDTRITCTSKVHLLADALAVPAKLVKRRVRRDASAPVQKCILHYLDTVCKSSRPQILCPLN